MQYNADPQQSTGYPAPTVLYPAPTVPYPGQIPSYQQSSVPNSYVMPGTNMLILAMTPRFKKFLIISGVLNVIYGIIIISLEGAILSKFSESWSLWIGIFIIIDTIAVLINGIVMISMARKLSYEIKPLKKCFTSALTTAIGGIFCYTIYLVLIALSCRWCEGTNYSTLGAVALVFFIILAVQSIISIIFTSKEQTRMLTSTPVDYQ